MHDKDRRDNERRGDWTPMLRALGDIEPAWIIAIVAIIGLGVVGVAGAVFDGVKDRWEHDAAIAAIEAGLVQQPLDSFDTLWVRPEDYVPWQLNRPPTDDPAELAELLAKWRGRSLVEFKAAAVTPEAAP